MLLCFTFVFVAVFCLIQILAKWTIFLIEKQNCAVCTSVLHDFGDSTGTISVWQSNQPGNRKLIKQKVTVNKCCTCLSIVQCLVYITSLNSIQHTKTQIDPLSSLISSNLPSFYLVVHTIFPFHRFIALYFKSSFTFHIHIIFFWLNTENEENVIRL